MEITEKIEYIISTLEDVISYNDIELVEYAKKELELLLEELDSEHPSDGDLGYLDYDDY